MAGDVKFIRVNGRVVPVRGKGASGGGRKKPKVATDSLQKRKGAKYDPDSGYYLDKQQRKKRDLTSQEDERYIDRQRKRIQPYTRTGIAAGAAFGALSSKRKIVGGAIGAALGFAAGAVMGHKKARSFSITDRRNAALDKKK